MNETSAKLKRYDAWAHIVRALANPTRLFLVDELLKGTDRCVCELSDLSGREMSTISRHLAILREAGILREYKQGRMVFYHLHARKIQALFECTECCVQQAGKG